MVEGLCEVENHQQNVDASYSDFVISEKVVECTEQTEWAQGLNLEALQTEGHLGQTKCCLRRWFADCMKCVNETSWEQNQKYQSNFGDNPEECGGRLYQMQLTGPLRSEQKLCHSQRLRCHWTQCCGRGCKLSENCTWVCSCWVILLTGKGQPFPAAWRERAGSRQGSSF